MSGMECVHRPCSTGLYSIHAKLLRIDLVMVRKSFQSDIDLGLDALFEVVVVVVYPQRVFEESTICGENCLPAF